MTKRHIFNNQKIIIMLNSITDTAQGTPKLNLNLMGEGNRLDFSEIEKLKTPTRTKSWRPLPHAQVIDEMRNQADKVGLNIVQEMHLTHRNDSRYFGLFEVQSESKDIASVVGLRNSHDKSFRASICAGDAPFVCSNLCFSNEIVLGRKHTSEILSDLSNIFREALNKFIDSRVDQAKRVEALKNFELTDGQAHDFICRAGRTEAIADAHIGKVITEWHTPEHDEFKDRNMWSLQNAFSNVWRSAPLQTARRSAELNQLIDAELVA
jgi:hypothetical protein